MFKNTDLMDLRSLAKNEVKSMNVFCNEHPLLSLRSILTLNEVITAESLDSLPSGKRVRLSGMLVIIHMPSTKSKKRVIFITLEDETGLIDLVVFPNTQTHFAREILTSEILTIEGKLKRAGKNGLSKSIVVEKVLRELSGQYLQILEKVQSKK